MATITRKTRFVCVSDTHNASPFDGAFKLPQGDVLIHAGDLTKQGTYAELKTTLDWIHQADFKIKLVVAGNHDITLDQAFYTEHGRNFHNQNLQDPERCWELVKSYTGITFLNHEYAEINMVDDLGSRILLRIFGSPLSPKRGLWAFSYDREVADADSGDTPARRWDHVPLSTDILITHTPPKNHCDESSGEASGCESLRQILWRVRPSLAICGHIHEGRGAERILWDLSSSNVRYKEDTTGFWEDPGLHNRKQSLVDLSSKSKQPLRNFGPWEPTTGSITTEDHHSDPFASDYKAGQGLGGVPPSGRCDLEAMSSCRMGRKETCVVNAAIMTSSWPYKTALNGARKFNKAIVVDLDLPVYEGKDEDTAKAQPDESEAHTSHSQG